MFITVKFNPADARTYTYRFDLPEKVQSGDVVEVMTARGATAVDVVAVDVPEPAFLCKPVLRVLSGEAA